MTSYPPESAENTSVSEQATVWFARMQADDVSPEERANFRAWIQRSPEHAKAYQHTRKLWQLLAMPAERVHQRLQVQPASPTIPLSTRKSSLRVPLIFSVMCLVILLGMQWPKTLQNWQSDYHTAPGEQRMITLEDGSLVTLNTDTALAINFSNALRSLELLRGEAYFDVTPNKSRPFIVHAGTASAQAVGTEFSVNRQGDRLTVSVNEGIVSVKDQHASTFLHATQQISYLGERQQSIATIKGTDQFAWRQGQVVFKQQALATVIEEVNRYRQGRITVINSRLAHRVINGVFNTADPDAVVEALQATLHAKATHLPGDWVLLY